MQFASDNWAGAAPEIVEAVAREAARFGGAYGESALDRAVEARFSEIFEREVAVFFVATGSAANALAFASVAKPGGVVFCHRDSHVVADECGGLEFQTGGARVFALDATGAKIEADALRSAIGRFAPDFVHSGQPMAVSVSQLTEAGALYAPEELRAISAAAHARGLPLHMDGARFANALVSLGVSPAEMTWKAGIDILSFGATKNGCICAEALVFFDPATGSQMPYLRKRAGQLFSKSRFVAAQFEAYLSDDLWLRLARHANRMADRLRAGLGGAPHAREAWPTGGNEVFVVLRRSDAERLRRDGAVFYDWDAHADVGPLRPDEQVVRLVTSFSTSPDEVDGLLAVLGCDKNAPDEPGRGFAC